MVNPFGEGENRLLRPSPTAVVIFGASGDLTHRKLIPALVNLFQDEFIPDDFVVVGASRTKYRDEDFRDELHEALKKYSRRPLSDDTWAKFSQCIFYQPLDAKNAGDFEALKGRLLEFEREKGVKYNYLYYLATSPSFFAPIAEHLFEAGLVEHPREGIRATTLVVEKPFGHDLESARELNAQLRKSFAEEQIYRIDHYLGKETVQNILVFRFANGIFEPLWNSRYIDHIQISVCEDIGVGSRAPYFDSHGILRDIVQNHVLQMLSLLCIEPPLSLSNPDSIRNEKVKVLQSITRLEIDEVDEATVRARYSAGFSEGKRVIGYRDEEGVAATSATETYIAWRLFIDNWRWSGVPIFIRAGKRLPKRATEIGIFFKRPPTTLFKGRQIGELGQNVLSIRVQPLEGISFVVNTKPPGPRLRVRAVDMDFAYKTSFSVSSPDAYERLLLDAMKRDPTLFTRDDEIEAAWNLLSPIFEAWHAPEGPVLHEYASGSWGPSAADDLIERSNGRWRQI
jgi:glucose-6-phosphate 1-dehydrogenase